MALYNYCAQHENSLMMGSTCLLDIILTYAHLTSTAVAVTRPQGSHNPPGGFADPEGVPSGSHSLIPNWARGIAAGPRETNGR